MNRTRQLVPKQRLNRLDDNLRILLVHVNGDRSNLLPCGRFGGTLGGPKRGRRRGKQIREFPYDTRSPGVYIAFREYLAGL